MRAARVRAPPGSSPSHPHLGPPKARIMSISWKPWASLGAPSPADAHDARACGAHHEVTAAGGSSIIEFAGAALARGRGRGRGEASEGRVGGRVGLGKLPR